VNEKDVRAAQIILKARGRARGYGAPGEAFMGDQTQFVIQHVTINAVSSDNSAQLFRLAIVHNAAADALLLDRQWLVRIELYKTCDARH
jgi:hypothetical protein